jgi:hypothetical protein
MQLVFRHPRIDPSHARPSNVLTLGVFRNTFNMLRYPNCLAMAYRQSWLSDTVGRHQRWRSLRRRGQEDFVVQLEALKALKPGVVRLLCFD